jgi:type II secretory pathway pseudopilin PulG
MNTKIPESKTCCQIRAAFTLVELLVVVGTVAVLAAMLLPALATTKPNGIIFQCLENQRRLAQAFVLYAADNNGTVVPYAEGGGFWYGHIVTYAGEPEELVMREQVLPGLTTGNGYANTGNRLYPYCSNPATFHCPGDMRYKLPIGASPSVGWAYDSYSKTQNVGGEPGNNYDGAGATYTNISMILVPSKTFCFIEDADYRGYNIGTWVVMWGLSAGNFTWSDPPAMFHGTVSTVAFADGHADFHKWTDPGLIQFGRDSASGKILRASNYNLPFSGPDYQYVHDNYRFGAGWK